MKKILVGGIILLTAVYSVFAGDAAAFVDLGFSSNFVVKFPGNNPCQILR